MNEKKKTQFLKKIQVVTARGTETKNLEYPATRGHIPCTQIQKYLVILSKATRSGDRLRSEY